MHPCAHLTASLHAATAAAVTPKHCLERFLLLSTTLSTLWRKNTRFLQVLLVQLFQVHQQGREEDTLPHCTVTDPL